jgi:hypothetical protein
MPANVVQTSRDEKAWARAKAAAAKQGKAKNYALIMHIYQQITKAEPTVDITKGLTPQELQERSRRKKASKRHARLAQDHRNAQPVGGNQMGRWKQEKQHDEAMEAHQEAADANRTAITDSSARDEADDASDEANTHPSVEETEKAMDVIEEMDKLIKAAQPGSIIGRTADGKEVYSQDADPLRKKKGGGAVKQQAAKPAAGKPAAAGQKPAKPGEEEDEDGEGSQDHHRDRALAHLQAAQAHASAAHSAKKVEEAKEHKTVVAGAREASEAAMADPEVKKAGEGSRGGTVIGHTRGGKPIYASTGSDHHQKMIEHHTKQMRMKKQSTMQRSDHRYARDQHKEAKDLHDRIAVDKERGIDVSGSIHDRANVRSAQANHSTASAHGMPRDVKESAWLGKSLITKADLSKGLYPRSDVTSWAGQFYGTPLYTEALRCLKEEIELDRQSAELSKKEMGWSAIQELPRSKRETQRAKEDKAREPLRKKRDALSAKRCGLEEKLIDHRIEEAERMNKLRAQLNKSIVTMVQALREPVIATKNNLRINMTSEEAVLNHLEKGAVVDGQAAGLREDARHRLLGMRGERMTKSYGGTAGGTIYQGEHDAHGSRGADFRETVARAQVHGDMVELDGAGNAGNGGLDEWFRDAWGKLDPEQAAASKPGAMRPKATGWQKGESPGDQPIGVIDDDDPYTRAVLKGGQVGEHQSALRMAYQGNGRENNR